MTLGYHFDQTTQPLGSFEREIEIVNAGIAASNAFKKSLPEIDNRDERAFTAALGVARAAYIADGLYAAAKEAPTEKLRQWLLVRAEAVERDAKLQNEIQGF